MGAPLVPPLNPSETIVLTTHLVYQPQDLRPGHALIGPLLGPGLEHVLRDAAGAVAGAAQELLGRPRHQDQPQVDLRE